MKDKWITKVTLAIAAFCIMPAVAFAESDTQLFKNWSYGQHIDSIPSDQGYYDCSEDFDGLVLCKDDVIFLEYSFQEQLIFNDAKMLSQVAVVTEFTFDRFATVLGALVRSFKTVYAEGSNETFDIIKNLHQGTYADPQNLMVAIDTFAKEQLYQGYLNLFMISDSEVASSKNATSLQDLLRDFPNDGRVVDVYVYENDWGSWLDATFYFPGKIRERMMDQAEEAPTEDF